MKLTLKVALTASKNLRTINYAEVQMLMRSEKDVSTLSLQCSGAGEENERWATPSVSANTKAAGTLSNSTVKTSQILL